LNNLTIIPTEVSLKDIETNYNVPRKNNQIKKEYISKLKKDGVLERIGDNRNGYWKVNK
jgi:predicted HTH transcriptional regulator